MTKVCVGGAYDGLVINGLEDQLACTGNEGHIEDRGGGGCASASIARGPDFTSRENLGVIASLVLFPLRLVRSRLTQSPTIKLLEKVNDELLSEIDDVANHDPSLRKELHEVVLKASYYASAMLQSKTDGKNNIDPVFTSGLHSQITATADRLKKAMRDEHKKQSLDNAVGMLKVLVGKKASEASALLLGNSQSHSPQFATSTSKIRLTQIPVRTSPFTVTEITVWSKIARLIMELDKATRAIAAKAAQLGSIAGSSVGDVTAVTGGYVQQFQNCDIYYSPDTGAHEVHGDIRAKYNALHGPDGVLGLPTTDETGTPDGFGRFNHFVGGSIYWTPDTGPMMVRGAIRDVWSGLGWERSWLGYPVADEYRMVTFSPATDPKTFWSHFQNGSILSSSDGAAVALTADLTPDVLKGVVRSYFDKGFHSKDVNIGLQPEVEILGVSNWGHGFWASVPRKITYRLHGFHDNGLAPDTDFELDVTLSFGLSSQPSFIEPSIVTLMVGLNSVSVTAHGLGSQEVADGVNNGVYDQFYSPDSADPTRPWVPQGWQPIKDIPTGADPHGNGIDVIGILLTAAGGLSVLLNPLPTIVGGFRKEIAQQQIDAFAQQ